MGVERYWDVWHGALGSERAERYPKAYGPPHNPVPIHRRRMELAASLIVGNSVLDIGCGIGHLLHFVKSNVEYVGADTSPEMLRVARGAYPNNVFCVGDVYDLSSFKVFDTVLCQSVLIHLPEIETPIREMWDHTHKAMVFSIPIAHEKNVKPLHRYGNKSILMHTTTCENIESIVCSLDGISDIAGYPEPETKIDNMYIRAIK